MGFSWNDPESLRIPFIRVTFGQRDSLFHKCDRSVTIQPQSVREIHGNDCDRALDSVRLQRQEGCGMTILKASGLTKVYGSSRRAETKALDGLSIDIEKGRFVGIMGPSGSGKTTLLNLLATIDTPTSGSVWVDGVNVAKLKGAELAAFRRRKLGFVFQDYNLLDSLSIGENIALPLVLDRKTPSDIRKRVREVSTRLGIESLLSSFPYEVSGGQQQRAAIARAIVHEPALVLADEPTGNLDSRSARALMDTFTLINSTAGTTILMVTHDPFAASFCQSVSFIRDGRLYAEMHKRDGRQAFFQQIMDALSQMGGGYGEHMADSL